MQRVSIEQVAIIAVDDVQGNIHSRDNTRTVKGLTKRSYQAKEEWLPVLRKRPGIDVFCWIIATTFTASQQHKTN